MRELTGGDPGAAAASASAGEWIVANEDISDKEKRILTGEWPFIDPSCGAGRTGRVCCFCPRVSDYLILQQEFLSILLTTSRSYFSSLQSKSQHIYCIGIGASTDDNCAVACAGRI
jgi:hypothetical protein